ncbi:AfsR/SARP family transcriptional regulator [Nonomuraea candida]|uniref:AfsR/SARP family transcriptional regulator n=1 Tax=Nonomuraea candida TaxID=359159 RepID=UPI0005BD6E3B|nr:tetratricopeptide repeat protein [Nonomuraea candida]
MRFTVLGPVGVTVPGRSLPALAPRHRAVLAYLLLHAGTPISAERLIGAMWGGFPPDTARAQIQASIAVIRRVLRAAGAPDLLATRPAGYVLRVPDGELDLEEFTTLVAATREASGAEAVELLRRALARWQGQALADAHAAFVPEARARLEERRLSVVERCAELRLELGEADQLVGELTEQLAAHPARERLNSHLMLALHRAGRQADALAAARAYRELLVERQGLDPSPAFVALEQAILRDEPGLRPPVVPEAAREPQRSPLCFLPYTIPDFVGRDAELDRLARFPWADGSMVTVSAIDGMAGIGKTALAVQAAYRLADRFPDGQLFVDLHAHTAGQAPVEPAAALESLLGQLGVPAERIPATLAARSALWRAELADRRALIVLDNAADSDHVRPLLPGATHSHVLITSRRRLVELDGAHHLSMDLLPARDAVELFTGLVGERAGAEPVAVMDVLRLCGFLPLAIRIAAARLRHRARWSVAYLAERLLDQRRRLAELSAGERSVAAAFALSYQQLEPGHRRVFRLLGLHPGTDIDPYAAAALAGLPIEEAEILLEDLLDAHVLQQRQAGHYTFHDLLRRHAHDLAQTEEPAESRERALTRLLDHYRYTASAAVDLLYPAGIHGKPDPPRPGTTAVPLATAAQAREWLEAERANLITMAAYAADHSWPGHTSDLAVILHRYLSDRPHYSDALALHGKALQASLRRGDRAAHGRALVDLGEAHFHRGGYEAAHDHYRRALDLYRAIGDRRGQARALNDLGGIWWRQRQYDRAHDCYRRSLELCRELGIRIGEAAGLANLGIVHERQGRYEEAHTHLCRAIELYGEIGERRLKSVALDNLGLVYRRQGNLALARDHHQRALNLCRELGYRYGEASALNGLGETARAMGDPARARHDHDFALALSLEIGSDPEHARAHDGLARSHADLGRLDDARHHAKEALRMYLRLDVPEADEIRHFLAGLTATG